MADDYARHGLTPPESAGLIDVTPPSMVDTELTGTDRIPMRYVPYNGGAVLPAWLLEPRTRPRITVTLGSVVPLMAGVGMLAPFLAAAGSVPADFVVTKGGMEESAFGPVPGNVRLVDWVPLGALLRDSDAVIHHGGAGTTLTALDAGLPQLVLPQGADQFLNAEAVEKAGAGAAVAPGDLDADRLAGLLADTAARAAAEAIAKGMAGQPTPAEVVPALIALAS
jgi:UDP:flavonoid glycosyltransferase YjiC (YdhE family)